MPASKSTYRLRFYGAGGAFSRRYGTTCSEILLPSGERWLIDCGRQAPDQLHAAGLSWHEVDGQLITHCHGDHVFGLEDFAFSRYFYGAGDVAAIRAGGPRIKLVTHSAVLPEIWEVLASSLRYVPHPDAPTSGTLATYFDALKPVSAEPPKGGNPWAHAERFETGELRVTLRETVHVPSKPSTSIEFDLGGSPRKIAWWSGDSTVDAALLQRLEPHATVFFHDCTFIEYPGQVHGSFSALEKLPEAVRRKMVLMHHEDDLESHRERAEALGFRIALAGHIYDLVAGQRIG